MGCCVGENCDTVPPKNILTRCTFNNIYIYIYICMYTYDYHKKEIFFYGLVYTYIALAIDSLVVWWSHCSPNKFGWCASLQWSCHGSWVHWPFCAGSTNVAKYANLQGYIYIYTSVYNRWYRAWSRRIPFDGACFLSAKKLEIQKWQSLYKEEIQRNSVCMRMCMII